MSPIDGLDAGGGAAPHVWDVRVFARESGPARAQARGHAFEAGTALQFDREYPHLTALEYVLGAVGTDLVCGMREAAGRRRVTLDRIEALVSGVLDNPLVHLGVIGEEGHPGVRRIGVKLYVSSVETPERIRPIWEEALQRSPLANTFRGVLDLRMEVIL